MSPLSQCWPKISVKRQWFETFKAPATNFHRTHFDHEFLEETERWGVWKLDLWWCMVVYCWLICKFWGYPTFKTYLISESVKFWEISTLAAANVGPLWPGLPQEHRTIRAEEVQCHHQGHNGNHLLSCWVWHSLYSTRVCHILSRFWPEICEHV